MLSIVLLTAGCDEQVDAIVGSDVPFTVWGYMNAGADTQIVRVFPVSDRLIPEAGALDARVFSTDQSTGERREWTYGPVRFDSLISGHVFWSPFRALHEHQYRLEVVRSDGETSSVSVTVPSAVQFDVQIGVGGTRIPIEIRGNVPNLVGLRVTYHAVNIPPKLAWPVGTPIAPAVQLPVRIDYDGEAMRYDGGWRFEIDTVRDYEEVQSVYRQNCLTTLPGGSAPDVWLRNMEFEVLAADSSWSPPGGVFDPDVLAIPHAFSNVENGYGFFGAGQAIRVGWTPPVETSLRAGFAFESRCQGLSPRNVPECWNPPVPCLDQ